MELSQEELCRLLKYEPDTGKLFWLHRPESMFKSKNDAKAWNSRYSGKEAFTAKCNRSGYMVGNIHHKSFTAHRVIWTLVYGGIPEGMQIDHKNRERSDNKLSNLRLATPLDNKRNSSKPSTNRSGYKGVSWSSRHGKWLSSISFDGKTKYLGLFEDAVEASEVYKQEAEKNFGLFASHLSK
jgi:HNH endonuclease